MWKNMVKASTSRNPCNKKKEGGGEGNEEKNKNEDWDVFQYLPPTSKSIKIQNQLQIPCIFNFQDRGNKELLFLQPLSGTTRQKDIISLSRIGEEAHNKTRRTPRTLETGIHQMPLLHVPMGGQGGRFGFLIVPVATQDIRGLKRNCPHVWMTP